jgi:hypothetical protein
MQINTEFEEKVCTGALDYLVRIYPQKAGHLANFDERRLIEFFGHHATYRRLNPHSKVPNFSHP